MCVCGGGGGVVPLSVSYSASLVFYEAHEYASWRMRCELCKYQQPKYADHTQTKGDGPQNPGQQSDTQQRSLTSSSAFRF